MASTNLREKDVEVKELVARGGFSNVHTGVVGTDIKRKVAIKEITLYKPRCYCSPFKTITSHFVSARPGHSMDSDALGAKQRRQGRMTLNDAYHEAELLKSMQEEVFMLSYYGSYVGRRGKSFCLVTELCVTNLRRLQLNSSILDKGSSVNKFPVSIAWHLGLPVLQALNHMHARGIIHRDIKEENILITSSGVPKVCDMGLAVSFTLSKLPLKPEADKQIGTNWYMAPELVKHAKYTHNVDAWGAAMTMLSMVRGGNPFENDADEEITLWDPTIVNFYKFNFDSLELAEKGSGQAEFYNMAKLDSYSLDPDVETGQEETLSRERKGGRQWKLLREFLRSALVMKPEARPSPGELIEGIENGGVRNYLKLWKEYLAKGRISANLDREQDILGKFRKQFNKCTRFMKNLVEEFK